MKTDLLDFRTSTTMMKVSKTLHEYCSQELADILLLCCQFLSETMQEAEEQGKIWAKDVIYMSMRGKKITMRNINLFIQSPE